MSFRGLLSLLATQQKKWYHHLQQVVQSLIPHKTTDNIGVPSKLHVARTHTRTVTELFTYEVLLYSNLYMFEYCCFHLNSGTVHPDIVHRNRKRALLTQSTVQEEFVEKTPGNCYNRLPTCSCPSAPPTIQQTGWFVQASFDVVAFCLRMRYVPAAEFPHLRRITTRPAVPDYNSFHSCRRTPQSAWHNMTPV